MQNDGGPLDDAAPQSLWDIQLVTRVTVSRGSSAWDAFSEWLMNREAPKASLLVSVPTLLSTALAHYADVLYQNGKSLTILLQLLTFVQRQYPDLKLYLKLPWAAAKRWILLAPTKHRTPVPEQLVMALITVTWLWG